MSGRFIKPSQFQPSPPKDQIITSDIAGEERLDMDVLFVGGGPAGLAGAVELARLVKRDNELGGGLGEVDIAVLEKAATLGEHCLSGAVVNPIAFRELFPELRDRDFPFYSQVRKEAVYYLTKKRAIRVPVPPTMRNHGFYVGSICEMVRWLGEKAEGLGVNIFAGYPAAALLVEADRVIGVRTTPSGLDRGGNPTSAYMPATDIVSKVTVLAEGTRGALSQAYLEWQGVGSPNPQIYALSVKELWETKRPLDSVVHTMGWPLSSDVFGGSWMYPLEPNLISLGLVVGLDVPDATLDVHELFQQMKLHPLFGTYLQGGEMIEWGAKTIPEGGYYSVPERRHGDGVLILGDSAGFVNVPALKGIHYAMQSGILAARTIFEALKNGDTSRERLSAYDRLVEDSFIIDDLRRTRNVRLVFKDGFYAGSVKAGLITLSRGRLLGRKVDMVADADVPRSVTRPREFTPDGKLTFSKVDAVFKSGNVTRDDIPPHLIVGKDMTEEVAELYAHMCPAGVYEQVDGELRINAPNCVDCKATDVLGPRWTPREGGSGPRYKRM